MNEIYRNGSSANIPPLKVGPVWWFPQPWQRGLAHQHMCPLPLVHSPQHGQCLGAAQRHQWHPLHPAQVRPAGGCPPGTRPRGKGQTELLDVMQQMLGCHLPRPLVVRRTVALGMWVISFLCASCSSASWPCRGCAHRRRLHPLSATLYCAFHTGPVTGQGVSGRRGGHA